MLRRLLEEWLPGLPLLCIPGNHDVPRSLRETFPESVSSSIWLRLLPSVIGSFFFFSLFERESCGDRWRLTRPRVRCASRSGWEIGLWLGWTRGARTRALP